MVAAEGPRFVSVISKVALLETVGVAGFALTVRLRSALAITVELAEALLSPGVGSSPAGLETLALLSRVPLVTGARRVKVAVPMALLARGPKANPIPLPDKLVVPELEVAETKVAPDGNGLVSSRAVAEEGPRLVIRRVKIILLPE